MRVFVAGASGATGRLVVSQLADNSIQVRAIIRERSSIPELLRENPNIEILRGSIDTYGTERIGELIADCDAVICCLGHTIDPRGIFGPPYNLVTHLVRRVAQAAERSGSMKKFILMSTTAYTTVTEKETQARKTSLVLSILKLLLPPHRDNMLAADFLIRDLGASPYLEWTAVRPDTLIDEDVVKAYDVYRDRQRDPLSDPGKTSRIQVAHFMASLLLDDTLWKQWRYCTPVVYNREE